MADNRGVGVRDVFVRLGLGAGAALGAALWAAAPATAFTPGPSCGEKMVTSPSGVTFKVLFANNGSVQRYEPTNSLENPEAINDARISIEETYGPAGVNAPPLKIISFKAGESGGMMVPDKAIDSCGRTLSFN